MIRRSFYAPSNVIEFRNNISNRFDLCVLEDICVTKNVEVVGEKIFDPNSDILSRFNSVFILILCLQTHTVK